MKQSSLNKHLALAGFYLLVTCSASVFAAVPVSPQSPWLVGPIASPSSSGSDYCSMKTRFPGEWNIIFARDMAGYNSIALESRKDRFTPGGQYLVRLVTGDVLRDKTFVAATKRVLVTQMGLDEDFYVVLSHAPQLNMAGPAVDASFILNGAGEAVAALDSCANTRAKGKGFPAVTVGSSAPVTPLPQVAIKESTMPAAAPVAPVEEIPLTAADARDTAVRVARLEREVAALRAENNRLADKVAVKQQSNRPVASTVASVPAAVTAAPADVEPSSGAEDKGSSLIEAVYDVAQMRDGLNLEQVADAYINQLKGGCDDDFAVQKGFVGKTLDVEAACINKDNGGRAAALTFYAEEQLFKVRVYESSRDDFDQALKAREAFLSTLR